MSPRTRKKIKCESAEKVRDQISQPEDTPNDNTSTDDVEHVPPQPPPSSSPPARPTRPRKKHGRVGSKRGSVPPEEKDLHKNKDTYDRLLGAIEAEGFGIVYTLDDLRAKYLPNKSIAELRKLIDQFVTLGKQRSQESLATGCQNQHQESEDGLGFDESRSTISAGERWKWILHHSNHPTTRNNTFADSVYPELFRRLQSRCKSTTTTSAQNDDNNEGHSYSLIYGYLSEVFGGSHPRPLPTREASVVRFVLNKIIEETSHPVDNFPEAVRFLASGNWARNIAKHRPGHILTFASLTSDDAQQEQEELSQEAHDKGPHRIKTKKANPLSSSSSDENLKFLQQLNESLNPLSVPPQILRSVK